MWKVVPHGTMVGTKNYYFILLFAPYCMCISQHLLCVLGIGQSHLGVPSQGLNIIAVNAAVMCSTALQKDNRSLRARNGKGTPNLYSEIGTRDEARVRGYIRNKTGDPHPSRKPPRSLVHNTSLSTLTSRLRCREIRNGMASQDGIDRFQRVGSPDFRGSNGKHLAS